MDLTIPYTLYPLALPHWIAWTLFMLALLGGLAVGLALGRSRGWRWSFSFGVIGAAVLLALSMVASMVITFLVHDI